MPADRPQKITFGEMRDMGVRGLLIYCADYRCSHSIAISGDEWPDDMRLSDIEPRLGGGLPMSRKPIRRLSILSRVPLFHEIGGVSNN